MVLYQGHGDDVLSVGEDHLGEFLPDRLLLDDDLPAAYVVLEDLVDVCDGVLHILQLVSLDLDPFPACEPDGFDRHGVLHVPDVFYGVGLVVEAGERDVPFDAVFLDEVPHEGLGGLYPGRRLGGRGAFHPYVGEGVHDACRQRGLGSDERELDEVVDGEVADLVDVGFVCQKDLLGEFLYPGVGVLHHGVYLRASAGEGAHCRVFPCSSTDCQDLHVAHLNHLCSEG